MDTRKRKNSNVQDEIVSLTQIITDKKNFLKLENEKLLEFYLSFNDQLTIKLKMVDVLAEVVIEQEISDETSQKFLELEPQIKLIDVEMASCLKAIKQYQQSVNDLEKEIIDLNAKRSETLRSSRINITPLSALTQPQPSFVVPNEILLNNAREQSNHNTETIVLDDSTSEIVTPPNSSTSNKLGQLFTKLSHTHPVLTLEQVKANQNRLEAERSSKKAKKEAKELADRQAIEETKSTSPTPTLFNPCPNLTQTQVNRLAQQVVNLNDPFLFPASNENSLTSNLMIPETNNIAEPVVDQDDPFLVASFASEHSQSASPFKVNEPTISAEAITLPVDYHSVASAFAPVTESDESNLENFNAFFNALLEDEDDLEGVNNNNNCNSNVLKF